jgi:hypothetical protein
MAYRTGVALHRAVRDGAVACDEVMRNAGPAMIAVARIATGVAAGGMGLEAAHAVTASAARRGVEAMNAAALKAASGMKATAAVKTASGMKASATVETAAATPDAAAPTTMRTAAAATARLGQVCEPQRYNCAREDRG